MAKILAPISMKDPIVDLNTGNITPYFQRLLQDISDARIASSLADALGGDPGADMVVIWDDTLNTFSFMTISEVLDWLGSEAQGDILYRGHDGWVLLPAGTDGDVLTTHGASANPTWETPSGGGGAEVFITSGTFSGASSVDVPLTGSSYVSHRVVFYSTFSSDGANLDGRVTTDSFSTVKSGASDYNYNSWRGNTSTNANTTSNAASSIRLLTNVGSAAGDDATGKLDIYFAADSAKLTPLTKHVSYGIGGSASPGVEVGDGRYLTAATVNGIRLIPSAGTMTGAYYVYGLSNA